MRKEAPAATSTRPPPSQPAELRREAPPPAKPAVVQPQTPQPAVRPAPAPAPAPAPPRQPEAKAAPAKVDGQKAKPDEKRDEPK
jgi:hypothetical protein